MTPDLVDLRLVRLVGAPRTEEVGNDHPIAGLDQRGDEVAVEIAPRRVAMHQHDRGRVTRALVYVMEPAVPGLVPVRLVRPRATECPVRVGHSGCASFDDGAFDGAGRFGYQNHLLPSFSSVLSDIVSLFFWARPDIGPDGLDLPDEQSGGERPPLDPESPRSEQTSPLNVRRIGGVTMAENCPSTRLSIAQEPHRNRLNEGSALGFSCHAHYTHVSQSLWRGLPK